MERGVEEIRRVRMQICLAPVEEEEEEEKGEGNGVFLL